VSDGGDRRVDLRRRDDELMHRVIYLQVAILLGILALIALRLGGIEAIIPA
jgi:hypothetical protein